jgi:hypothetical protein
MMPASSARIPNDSVITMAPSSVPAIGPSNARGTGLLAATVAYAIRSSSDP